MAKSAKSNETTGPRSKRAYLSQAEVPGCALEDALRVPRAIAENYGFQPTAPLKVAAALEMQPNAGRFRLLTGAAIAYGVTAGGPNAPEISNVLIEIGAAMALFGRRFILLVREGVKLPSNLQGLFEVRYTGDTLDGEATIKLLEAINDIKNHPMPDRYRQAQE